MRIISFSKKWDKFNKPEFTTFRYPRGDSDWYVGEKVQVYFKNRTPQREKLGEAEITLKEVRELDPEFANLTKKESSMMSPPNIPLITDQEAIADGFNSREDLARYMEKQYGLDYISRFNKLTLRWIKPCLGFGRWK